MKTIVNQTQNNTSYAKKLTFTLIFFTCGLLLAISLWSKNISEAACAETPDVNKGTNTMTVSIPQTGTYKIWSRIIAPDAINNSYYLQIDGGCAYRVGDSQIPTNTWSWVGYQNGTPQSGINVSLIAGNHQIVMTGRETNVGVDKVLFLSDLGCVPTDKGDNCTVVTPPPPPPPPTDTTPPDTTINNVVVDKANATATFTSNEAGSTFECNLDNAVSWKACSSPQQYTNLANGSHTLKVRAKDAAGNTDQSPATKTFTINVVTPPPTDTTPPDTTINNVNVDSAGVATVTFSSTETGSTFECKLDGWANYKPCTSPQQYPDLAAGNRTIEVRATDKAGNIDATPATKTFTINVVNPPPTDTTAPQLTITSPANNAIVSGNTTINANASDNVGITKVEFSVDNTLKMTDTATPYNYSINTLSYPNGNHTVKVIAYDAAGNTKTANLTLNIQNADITPPNSPASLSGNITQPTTDSTGKVSLSWPAASDNPGGSGIKAYLIYRNDKAISFVAANQLSYVDTNLSTGTYSYTIRSLDYADLTSTTASPVFKATLNAPPQPDTQAPSVPAGLTAASPAPTQVNLSWKASSDNGGSGIAGYNVYRNGSNTPINSQLITTTSFGDGTADPETSYSYQVEAVDGAGNKSQKTSATSITTKKQKPSDVTGDDVINIFDLSRLSANWGKANPTHEDGDINGDGKIDVFDLSILASDWGK